MIKQISINKERVYIPEFDGNKKQDPSEQIKVHYKAITASMKDDLIKPLVELRRNAKSEGDFDQVVSTNVDKRKVLDKLIDRIENLGYSVNGGETKKVATVDSLFNADIEVGLYPLIEELFVFFNDMLNQKVDEKN